jgi:hypothetical protein
VAIKEADEALEVAVSRMAKRLRRVAALQARLDKLTGYTTPSLEVRTQGGDHTTQAELRVELQERLRFYTADEIRLAELLTTADGEKGRYSQALLAGFVGEGLRRRARLSKRAMNECRRWLSGIVEALQGGGIEAL